MYKAHHYTTPANFLEATSDFLSLNEIENNLTFGLAKEQAAQPAPPVPCAYLAFTQPSGAICATVMFSRKRWIIAGNEMNAALQACVANALLPLGLSTDGIFGQTEPATALASMLMPGLAPKREMVAHALETLSQVPLPAGRMKVAGLEEVDLCTDWLCRFNEELEMTPKQTVDQIREKLVARANQGKTFLWMDESETPVSMAVEVRETPQAGIIGGVFTPPELRGRGLARACVHQATAELLRRGKRLCGLFTDKHNPVSNRIYHQIGYRPIAEFADFVW